MDISTKRDVIVVGAGAAGLTAALHLANQNLKVSVIDGAAHPGAENWSGCVFFGENLSDPEILGPDWQKETAIERPLVTRGIYMTNGLDTIGLSYKDPETFKNCATVLRPVFDHDLSEIARSKGVEILSRTNALGLLKEDGRIIGVATEKGPFYSDLVFLAEGDAAHLVTKEGYSNLASGDKGHYLQGIKEVIHLKPSEIEKRFNVQAGEGAAYEMIIRNARIGGKTAQLNMGAFIYTNRESLSIGLVLPLDNLAEHFKGDHNNLMEWFKSLPVVQKWIEGGERTAYGAKIINANGFNSLARFCDNGLAIGGACTGMGIDFPYPNYTGPASFTGLCLGRAVKAIKESGGDFSKTNLEKFYSSKIKESHYYTDMKITRNWGEYIKSTKSFFSLFCDMKLDCAHPFFEGKGFFRSFHDSCRSFFYHAGNGKLTAFIKDLLAQKKASGAKSVGPLGAIGALFCPSPLKLPAKGKGSLSIKYYNGKDEVTDKMHPFVKNYMGLADKLIKTAFNVLYRNHGETLDKKFKTLNHIIAKRGFLLILFLMLAGPFIALLALFFGVVDVFTSKEKIMKSATAKRIMAARKVQEISSFKAESSVEDKLSSIVYETEKNCHIKVHWPRNTYLPESDPNAALWHICPAGVYHAEKDPAGMLRPVVDYENCVKCESCWRGSPLVDWGRRGSHRLTYRVKTSAVSSLIRHQSLNINFIESGEASEYNKPISSSDKQLLILNHIDSLADRIHDLVHSRGRILDSTEREWISKLIDEMDGEINKLSTDFPEKRISLLKNCLENSIEKIKEFLEIERFFWIDAELQIMKQHALCQLGVSPLQAETFIPERADNPAENAAEHFTLAKLHHIKKHGFENDDLTLLKDWISHSNEQNEKAVINSLSKVDLSLTALFLNCRLAQKICQTDKFISLTVSDDISVSENTLSGTIPVALSAIANEYLLVTSEGAWKIDPKASGVSQKAIGTIGLRKAAPLEITLSSVTAEKIDFKGTDQLIEEGIDLYYEAVLGAGEYLLDKSITHASGRIQFPDLFQDEHGRDGIIKFGAVKALIAHIACRLEMLKAAKNSDIPAALKYVQAGKWLGTQEGSFTYNATQVFGGTGFSEDDTLSPYYRDASIFKFLLGDPFKVQTESVLTINLSEQKFENHSLLEEPFEWLNKALESDKSVKPEHKALYFRSVSDFLFISELLKSFKQAENNGENLLYLEQIIEMAAKIYWNSATSRDHDSKSFNSRKEIGERLQKENWKVLKPKNREFSYEKFLENIPASPTGDFLVNPNFDAVRYSPENRASDPELAEKAKELNEHFKSYFIDKDFDGKSYCRYAEEMHGHSDEVIQMFHDKGYMKLIIPAELGGGGNHKSIYYLLISASMQYGDPALSLIIQASTSIGTSPMLLAWKKDIPKAIKDVEGIESEKKRLTRWVATCREIVKTLENPDPKTIKVLFKSIGDEVKTLAGKNSVFKSQCSGFLYALHKAGQAGMSFQLDVMAAELERAAKKLEAFIPTVDSMADEFKARKKGVGFFLSMIASGQTSAFALTEPSAGSDTARVATRASIKELELNREQNGSYTFKKDDGETRILIDLEQTRFEKGSLQIRLKEEDEWSEVLYDKYSWADDSGYRYFKQNDDEFIFHEFGRVIKENDKFIYRYYELTGSKMWITNGRFAGLFALYAKTQEGITGLCVDRYAEGLTIGKDEDKMGQNASPTNEVFLDKVRVCTSFVLGLEGRGQVNALETLNVGRAGLSLSSLALTEDMIEAAVKFSSGSEKDSVLIGQMMEEMSGAFPASYEMIGIFDTAGSDARMESAIGKFMNSEILHRAILYSEGIHSIHSQTYNHDVEKKKRDARILNIYEGTNEIQRFLILKDLIEQLSRKDYSNIKVSASLTALDKWDELRIMLLDLVKKVKKDVGSKAWMDSQLQPVFFYLAEIAGWLKFTDGAIWRLIDIRDDKEHVIFTALEAAIKRGLFEVHRKMHLFDSAYSRLSKGIRPPEITIPGLLLDKMEEHSEDCILPGDTAESDVKIQAFLACRPLNKPQTEILNGKNIDDQTSLTNGSLKLFNRLKSLPAGYQIEIVIAAPQSAQGLVRHLSSIANIKWINTKQDWPGADTCTGLWKEQLKEDHLLVFDGSSSEWLGAAGYAIASAGKTPQPLTEFSIQKDGIHILSDSGRSVLKDNSAIILASGFNFPAAAPKRKPGNIIETASSDISILKALLPAEPEKTESAHIDSADSAAAYLSKELGIEPNDNVFILNEVEYSGIDNVCLVGSVKNGEISRDTVSALNSLQAVYPEIILILPAASGIDKSALNKLNTVPVKTVFADFPESWMANSRLAASCISEIIKDSANNIFFVSSRAAEAGSIAVAAGRELKTALSRIKAEKDSTHIWSEQAEGTVIIESECTGSFIGIMSSSPEPLSAQINNTGSVCRVDCKGSAELESVKQSLQSSAASLGVESISDAEFIIDIGYGIGNQDNYDEFIQPLVDTLRGLGVKTSIGASRKLVETLKILPPETQIGQSGSSVSPKILLAIGISGAPQHINYIGKSTVVLCFNIDEQAPLMLLNESKPFPKVYPVPGDLKKTIPALRKALEILVHAEGAA